MRRIVPFSLVWAAFPLPLNSYIEVLTPRDSDVSLCGDKAFEEVVEVKLGHMSAP